MGYEGKGKGWIASDQTHGHQAIECFVSCWLGIGNGMEFGGHHGRLGTDLDQSGQRMSYYH